MKKAISLTLGLVLVFSLSISAFAAPTAGEVPVTGTIQNTETDAPTVGGDDTFSVTIPTAVNWYITQNSYPNVSNTATGTGVGETGENEITNNSTTGAQYAVSFASFTGDTTAAELASNLTLHLTGDLAEDNVGDLDLSEDYTGAEVSYTAKLTSGTPWMFGFSGSIATTYSLSTAPVTPTYTMTLTFDLA